MIQSRQIFDGERVLYLNELSIIGRVSRCQMKSRDILPELLYGGHIEV